MMFDLKIKRSLLKLLTPPIFHFSKMNPLLPAVCGGLSVAIIYI